MTKLIRAYEKKSKYRKSSSLRHELMQLLNHGCAFKGWNYHFT